MDARTLAPPLPPSIEGRWSRKNEATPSGMDIIQETAPERHRKQALGLDNTLRVQQPNDRGAKNYDYKVKRTR